MRNYYRDTPYFVAVYFVVVMLMVWGFNNPLFTQKILRINFVVITVTLALWHFVNRLKQDPTRELAPFGIDVFVKSNEIPAWEQIPDIGWDQEALRMLIQGFPFEEIAKAVGVTVARVRNRFSELRNLYGETVPYRRPPRKK